MKVGFYEKDITPPLGCDIPGYANLYSRRDLMLSWYINNDRTEYETQSMAVRMGDILISGISGEVFSKFVYDIRNASPTDKNICIFEDGCDSGLLRKLVHDGLHLTSGLFAAFSAREIGGYAYVIGTKEGDLAPLAKEISATLGGRGGGKGPMITGFVDSDEETIKEYFSKKTV